MAALSLLAQIHRAASRVDVAGPLCARVLQIARSLDDRESIAAALLNLAMVAIARADADEAHSMLREALVIVAETGARSVGQGLLESSVGLATLREQWRRAAQFFGAAGAQAEQSGLRPDLADELFLRSNIERVSDALGDEAFRAAEAIGRSLTYDAAIGELALWLENRAAEPQ